tara:strand:+ start:30940 stop:31623 length:684 start_codon:yes stop_codon:yes gene_type:complete
MRLGMIAVEVTNEAEVVATVETTNEVEVDATAETTVEVETAATVETADEVETDATGIDGSAETTAEVETDATGIDGSAETTVVVVVVHSTKTTDKDLGGSAVLVAETAVDQGKTVISGMRVEATVTAVAATDAVHGRTVATVERAVFDPRGLSVRLEESQVATRTTAGRNPSAEREGTTIEGESHGRGRVPRRPGSTDRRKPRACHRTGHGAGQGRTGPRIGMGLAV